MIVNVTVITGSEKIEGKASSPENALIEFYQAFNIGDMDLMSSNWEQTAEVSMSNPLGGVKRGWDSIKSVYERIFNGSAKVYVEFYDYTIHRSGVMFIAVGRERGYFQQGENKIDLAIRTSRTYRLDCGRWHQIHHHGSIEDPSLLKKYQSAVLAQ
ncbi:MAG: nuclear transport factor 2 family protein [Candidatus Sedimenticola sp. PURPLELP]